MPEGQSKEFEELWKEFDRRKTNDARYASAIDALQPFLNNYYTQGRMWKLNKAKSSQVYKRQERIKNAIPKLWPFIDNLIKDAIKKGYLEEG